MNLSTHHLCVIAQYLKFHYEPRHVRFRKKEPHSLFGMKEADIEYLLTVLMLARKPLYRLSLSPIKGVSELWREWVIGDFYRLVHKQEGDKKIHPLWRKEQYLFNREDLEEKAFETSLLPHDFIHAEIGLAALIDQSAWTACHWHARYQPLSDAWRHTDPRKVAVDFPSLLQLNCPSVLLAAMTDRSRTKIDQLRRECFGDQVRIAQRHCGPQLTLLRRSSRACFFVFQASLIFHCCRSLGFQPADAFYWAINEVKEIPGFGYQVPQDFWLETNLFYWLCVNGHFQAPKATKGNEGKLTLEMFPRKLRAYCEGCEKEKLPTFSLRHLRFQTTPNMGPGLKRFIWELNTRLAQDQPKLPIFWNFTIGALG